MGKYTSYGGINVSSGGHFCDHKCDKLFPSDVRKTYSKQTKAKKDLLLVNMQVPKINIKVFPQDELKFVNTSVVLGG